MEFQQRGVQGGVQDLAEVARGQKHNSNSVNNRTIVRFYELLMMNSEFHKSSILISGNVNGKLQCNENRRKEN